MKKMICLILAVLMAAAGTACFAEGAEASVTFVRIRDNTTANVYETPGDTEAADTLEGGSLCILIAEADAAGTAWYNVFYLNSRKEGTFGYIRADDAEKLSQEQLAELMNDSNQINKLFDLVEALNDYADTESGEELSKDSKTNGNNGNNSSESPFEKLYNESMDELEKVFGTDITGKLDKISEATGELAEKAKEAGKDLMDKAGDVLEKAAEDVKKTVEDKLPEAKETLENLPEKASDALDSVMDGTTKEDWKKLLDKVTDSMDSLKKDAEKIYQEYDENVREGLDTLNKNLGKNAGDTLDQVTDLVDKAQNLLDSGIIQSGLGALGDQFKEEGFSKGASAVTAIIQLLNGGD